MDCVLGIDIGGTNVKFGIVRHVGDVEVIAQCSIPTQATDPPELLVSRIADTTRSLLALHPNRVVGIGWVVPVSLNRRRV